MTCVFISYSVNQLAEVLRCTIEQEAKILYELKLPGVNFKINQVPHSIMILCYAYTYIVHVHIYVPEYKITL